jgi:hypothetical protein
VWEVEIDGPGTGEAGQGTCHAFVSKAGIRRSPLYKPIELRSLKNALFDVKTYILEQEERST